MADNIANIGNILKQRRVMIPLTLGELARVANVSASHLGRIEREERHPSAQILRKIAKPLGFDEAELLVIGAYLSPEPSGALENISRGQLDPYVASVLSQESVEIQRAVISILIVIKNVARNFQHHLNIKEEASNES